MTETKISLPFISWRALNQGVDVNERFGKPNAEESDRIKSSAHPSLFVRQTVRAMRAEIDMSSQPVTSFIKELISSTETIPEEFRSSAEVEFDIGDECFRDRICIFYERPETDDEMTGRIERHILYVWRKEQREKESLRELPAKYPEGA